MLSCMKNETDEAVFMKERAFIFGFKKKQSQNLEHGLMSSFDKKTEKKKYKVLDKNKETGDSNLFKDQAGSVSNAFKKLK